MPADVATTLPSWSTTAGSNAPTGSTAISSNLDDNLRQIQAVVRTQWAAGTIASAATTNLASVNERFVTVTGTTTITGLGTVSAGIEKVLIFSGALTLTHNGTSLILPGSANVTTAAGDVAIMLSLGSGNWRCIGYSKANGTPVAAGVSLDAIGDAATAGTVDSADYAQTWRWRLTTAAKTALLFTESLASTGGSGSQFLFRVESLASSTAEPLMVSTRGTETFRISREGKVTFSCTQSGNGGDFGVSAARSIDLTTTSTSAAAVQFNTGAGGSVRLNGGADAFPTKFRIPEFQKLTFYADAASPTISAGGGTGPSIAGQDQAFVVTIGSGNPTSVTVAFASAFATAPIVTASSSQSGLVLHVTPATGSVQIQSSAGMASGTKIYCIAMGYEV